MTIEVMRPGTTQEINNAQIAGLLGVIPSMLQHELAVLPDEISRFRPAPGEWSINEVLGHLIEAEQRGFAGRIRQILAEDAYVCQTWDPDQVAEARGDETKASTALLDDFIRLREQSIALVLTLTADQLARSGQHPVVGKLSIQHLLYEWIYHDRNHLKQIESNILAWYWPQLGNAQGFYPI
ncbi:MAG: DinB family protein [Chloroflexi bacterium]|nr:DinB family protein [Chloroflexota bacterium]